MPEYVYKCDDGHFKDVLHRMLYSTSILCDCGLEMRRVPQMPAVTWGGLPPHRTDEIGPAARDLLDNAEANREAFIAKQEKRGKYLNE